MLLNIKFLNIMDYGIQFQIEIKSTVNGDCAKYKKALEDQLGDKIRKFDQSAKYEYD